MKRWIRSFGKWLALAVWILAAGFCYSCGQQGEAISLQQETAVQTEEQESGKTGDAVNGDGSEEPAPADCFVYVCGEVVQPGVYQLKEGQRVYEAIALAGGFTDAAAQSVLNLAEPVQDGMKLEVPDQEWAEAHRDGSAAYGQISAAWTDSGGKININTASMEQLKTLTGIGEARAGDIIRYRQEHGRFDRIEDIMKVPGIKTSAFEKIKNDISVAP